MSLVKQPELVDFISYSLAAFQMWVTKEFSKYNNSSEVLNYHVVSGPAALRQLSSRLNSPDKQSTDYISKAPLVYPYLLAAIGDISLDGARNGYNRRAYHQLVVAKDMERNVARAYNLRPVRVGLGMIFNTDNQKALIAFSTSIILNSPAVTAVFEGEGGFEIGIKMVFDPNVSIPPVNYETPGEAYQFSTVVTLETFVGTISELPLITSIRVKAVDVNRGETDLFNGSGEELMKTTIQFTDQFS